MNLSTPSHRATTPATPRFSGWAGWFDPGDPHPYQGPFTRWPRLADGLLCVIVFIGSVFAVAVSALPDGALFTFRSLIDRPAPVVVLLALAAGALPWRRHRPTAVTLFVLIVMAVWAMAGYGDGQELALVVAAYSVGRYVSDDRKSLAVVATIIVVSLAGTVIDANQRVDVAPALLLSALPWYVGRRVRNRGDYLALLQERARRLEAEQHAEARRAVAEERSRIARELHDVVAHQVSMMTVQAGAAKTVARVDLDGAIDAMGDVEEAGRQALGELRHLLGVLRADRDQPDNGDDLGPQPGLQDIPALAEQLRHTGANVSLHLGDHPPVPTAVSLSGYRIVQEATTNIIKHAGAEPVVEISVSVDNNQVVIDIINTVTSTSTPPSKQSVPTQPPTLPTSGFGLAGMRERATLLGGSLTAGRVESNLFRVHARLPLEPEPR